MPAPLPTEGGVIVHVIDPAEVSSNGDCFLIPAELEQAARFRFEKDACRWKACREALRQILGNVLEIPASKIPLEYTEYGKPFLPSPYDWLHFNLSHCEDLALVALSVDGPVGIDIEPVARGKSLLGCEQVFCHPREIATLPMEDGPRASALLDLWTRKEALLKALGTGMSLAPDTVALTPPGEHGSGDHPSLAPFRVQRLEHPLLTSHIVRIALLRSISAVTITG